MTFRDFIVQHRWATALWNWGVNFIAEIKWPRLMALYNGGMYYRLKEVDHDKIRRLLKENYLIILTRRSCHLTTYMTAITTKLTTGLNTYYTHALMNVEGDIANNIDFKLIEATGDGVHYSTFLEVFDCDSVALFKPKNVTLEEWTAVMDVVKNEYGDKYDTLFDLSDETTVSCVEMVYNGVKRLANWKRDYAELIALIETHGNDLTPQMLYDCGDLELVFEARR